MYSELICLRGKLKLGVDRGEVRVWWGLLLKNGCSDASIPSASWKGKKERKEKRRKKKKRKKEKKKPAETETAMSDTYILFQNPHK